MKAVFTIIPDPEYKKDPVIIRQDNPRPNSPAIVVPPDRELARDIVNLHHYYKDSIIKSEG